MAPVADVTVADTKNYSCIDMVTVDTNCGLILNLLNSLATVHYRQNFWCSEHTLQYYTSCVACTASSERWHGACTPPVPQSSVAKSALWVARGIRQQYHECLLRFTHKTLVNLWAHSYRLTISNLLWLKTHLGSLRLATLRRWLFK